MLDTLRNAWRLKILEKIVFDYAIGVQDGAFIPVPLSIPSYKVWLGKQPVSGHYNRGRLCKLYHICYGYNPYINSSIIMQLLTVAIPKLEQLRKEKRARKDYSIYSLSDNKLAFANQSVRLANQAGDR